MTARIPPWRGAASPPPAIVRRMWPDIAAWFQSTGGARVLQTAIVPALAILVAGLLAALIARAALRSALRRADREQAATAVAGLVEAARAVTDSDGGRDRRRAARLRTEADVRVRLLSLPGADRAADWAAAGTQSAVAAHAEGRVVTDLAALRDPLIAWVRTPRRAKRLFSSPASLPTAEAPTQTPAAEDRPPKAEPAPESAPHPARSTARAATAAPAVDRSIFTPPMRTDADESQEDDGEAVPAWRRTKSAERLQQSHPARATAVLDEQPDDAGSTTVVHPHRAAGPPVTDSDDADSQASRHARPVLIDEEQPPVAQRRVPEWLDTYDDEADVTQNLDLRTPPPVSASKVRDRAPNTDIVPRP